MPNQTIVRYHDQLDDYQGTITLTFYRRGEPERKSIAAEPFHRMMYVQSLWELLPSFLPIIVAEIAVVAGVHSLQGIDFVQEFAPTIILVLAVLVTFLPSPRKVPTWEEEVVSFTIATQDSNWTGKSRSDYRIDLPQKHALRMVKNVVKDNGSAIDSAVELVYSVQKERGGECLHDEVKELLKTIFNAQETVAYNRTQEMEDSAREQIEALSDAYRNIAELTKEINNENQ